MRFLLVFFCFVSPLVAQETVVAAGTIRPIRPGDLRPPAIVERNEIVSLRYNHGGLLIITEGRALDRAALGESLRVINMSSRQTVTAVASAPGLVVVGPNP
jgi:flagella basal body P-ring formation protein FlgA